MIMGMRGWKDETRWEGSTRVDLQSPFDAVLRQIDCERPIPFIVNPAFCDILHRYGSVLDMIHNFDLGGILIPLERTKVGKEEASAHSL